MLKFNSDITGEGDLGPGLDGDQNMFGKNVGLSQATWLIKKTLSRLIYLLNGDPYMSWMLCCSFCNPRNVMLQIINL